MKASFKNGHSEVVLLLREAGCSGFLVVLHEVRLPPAVRAPTPSLSLSGDAHPGAALAMIRYGRLG